MLVHNSSVRVNALRGTVNIIFVLAIAACSRSDKAAVDTPSTAMPTPSTSAPVSGKAMSASDTGMKNMKGMEGMAMTGDADRDFLRMMSDHHEGMILMAHMTKDQKALGAAAIDAEKLDTKQDVELDKMVTMLEKTYKDPYTPKVLPDNQAMANELKGKSGADYSRTFYQNVVKHHQEAITMVDNYLPKSKSTAVRQMAAKMKADQTKEIAEFQKRIAQIK